MIDSLANLINFVNNQSSSFDDLNSFQSLNIQLYQKNKKHKYLYSNDYLAKSTGMETGLDLINQTDFDLSWSTQAKRMQSNDLQVMHEAKPFLFLESATRPSGVVISGISYKTPLYSRSKKIIGITGLSFEFPTFISSQQLPQLNLIALEKASFFSKLEAHINLSPRQKECLYYLCKGGTLKKIAHILQISPRTVEHHIELAKLKFACYSRTHLIEKILQLTYFF